MRQSADLILNPRSDSPVRLMLAKGKNGARMWKRQRVPRKPGSQIETTYEWTDWSGGDGHTRIIQAQPGPQPNVTAEGAAEVRWPGRITLPPLRWQGNPPRPAHFR